jgi:hypothetical protein
MAQDEYWWRDLVNTTMSLPLFSGSFSTISAIIGFSKRTLPHGFGHFNENRMERQIKFI